MNQFFGKLLMCFAIEFENFEQRVTDLIREAVPGLSNELIDEWEEDLGLPSPGGLAPATTLERAQIAHAKYTANNSGQSKQFYIDFAASLGAVVTVQEYQGTGSVFRVDVNRVDRMPGSETPTERIYGARLWSLTTAYKWVITIVSVNGDVSEKNVINQLLQRIPAHTEVIFN